MSKITMPFSRGIILSILCCACSCSTEQAVREALGASVETPVFLGLRVLSAREIQFEFSEPVAVRSLNFDPPLDIQSISGGTATGDSSILVTIADVTAGGIRIVADMLVEDEAGNTLAALVPFRSRNDQIPRLRITELRTEYAKPKTEFVELKALSAGNLGAIRLFIAGAGLEEPVFEFPPAEVAAGEYLVVHLRTLEPESVDETGTDLSLSGGVEALPEARDFWVPGAVKRLRKTDAVLLMDQADKILDGALISENPDDAWAKEDLDRAARLLAAQGAWQGAEGGRSLTPRDAIPSKGTAPTRTICRDETVEDRNTAAGWFVAATSQASPGKPNSGKRYEPKP
jgi:hypothetical protein